MTTENEMLFANSNLLLTFITTVAAISAAIFTGKTLRKQAQQVDKAGEQVEQAKKQVELMTHQLEDARRAESDRVRAICPRFALAKHEDLPRHGGHRLDLSKDVIFDAEPGLMRSAAQALNAQEDIILHLALTNRIPENRALLPTVFLLSGPSGAKIIDPEPMIILDSRGEDRVRDTWFIGIQAKGQHFHDRLPIEFEIRYQTTGGHLVSQRFLHPLGGRAIQAISEPA